MFRSDTTAVSGYRRQQWHIECETLLVLAYRVDASQNEKKRKLERGSEKRLPASDFRSSTDLPGDRWHENDSSTDNLRLLGIRTVDVSIVLTV